MNLLAIHALGQSFGTTTVFGGLDFSLAAGDRLAVLGASGAGKSTLLRLLAGLDRPRTGRIERAPGLKIGMVFQDLALWPNLTALDNVALALHERPRRDAREAARTALHRCRVGEFATRLPGTLSVGQQQRVALARAIAGEPGALLLDEPFSSLDLLLKQELFATVCEVANTCALVLVTHDPLEALALCRTALVLEAGSIVEHGPLGEMITHPASQLLRLFSQRLGQALGSASAGATSPFSPEKRP
jgi:ABC-type sulfate/molybdate transport systems ATPase subunit